MSELPEIVQALLNPEIYPDPTQRVELVQTQMSFLFLTDRYVYKVKKSVNFGFLDYTTLEKRRFFCQQEVKLNRRLSPDVYLAVVTITDENGNFSIEGQGTPTEYAVKMRRLPQERMMNILLNRNQVSPEMLADVAKKIADFHRRAETGATINNFGGLDTVIQNTDENSTQTEKYIGTTISQQKYDRLKSYTEAFIQKNTPLFHQRVNEGRIKDCHGDLHAAHICFTDGIAIYDCIEFNDRFRYCDVTSEVAFLAMDLDHYGRADLSRAFITSYVAESRDTELLELLNFYKCYRAYVRGKVESFQLDDPYIEDTEKSHLLESAGSYFDLADSYIRSRPVLVITTGFVGTGKTALAQALARRLGLVAISSDVTRKRLASIPLTEHHFQEFDTGIYSTEATRKTYDRMFDEAKSILTEGGSVILDASFIKSRERQTAKRLAEEADADFFIVECTLDEAIIRERLDKRMKEGSASDGRWEILEPQKKHFEPITEASPANHIKVNMASPPDKLAKEVAARIAD